MLRFSANLCTLWTERPLEARFRAASAAGFQAVELQYPYALRVSPLAQLLRDNGLRLVLINAPAGDLLKGGNGLAGVPGKESAFRLAVQAAARYAEALGVPAVNIQAGRKPQGVLRTACEDTLLRNLEYASGVFRDAGAVTLVEAVNVFDQPRSLVSSLDAMEQLCRAVPSLRMLFHCYHMHRMSKSMRDDLAACLPRIGHVQFADNPGRQEPGTGRIDYEAVFALLRESPYRGWCGAGYHPSRATEETLAWRQVPLHGRERGLLRAAP